MRSELAEDVCDGILPSTYFIVLAVQANFHPSKNAAETPVKVCKDISPLEERTYFLLAGQKRLHNPRNSHQGSFTPRNRVAKITRQPSARRRPSGQRPREKIRDPESQTTPSGPPQLRYTESASGSTITRVDALADPGFPEAILVAGCLGIAV